MKEFLNDVGLLVICITGFFVFIAFVCKRLISYIISQKQIIYINDPDKAEEIFMKAFLEKNKDKRLTNVTDFTIEENTTTDVNYSMSYSDTQTDYTFTDEEECNTEDIISLKTPEEREFFIRKIKERIESDNRSNL